MRSFSIGGIAPIQKTSETKPEFQEVKKNLFPTQPAKVPVQMPFSETESDNEFKDKELDSFLA
jgi:hypothetical protein